MARSHRNPRPLPAERDDFSRSAVLPSSKGLCEPRSQALSAWAYAEMHFELGDAYLEMGLTTDSIREWLLSAEHSAFACESSLRIAQAYLSLGVRHAASAALDRAQCSFPSREQQQRAEQLLSRIAELSESSPVDDGFIATIDNAWEGAYPQREPSTEMSAEASIDRALDAIFDFG